MRLIKYIILTILATSSVAWSQSEHGIDCYIGSGLSFLSGPQILTKENKMGISANSGLGFGLHIVPSVSLIFSVDYTAFPKDEAQARQEVVQQISDPAAKVGSGISIGDGGIFSILTITGNIKILLASHDNQIAPYLIAGVGFMSTSISDIQASYMYANAAQTAIFGASTNTPVVLQRTQYNVLSAVTGSVGVGIDMPFTKTSSIYIESRYVIGYTSFGNTTYFPAKLGLRFSI